MWRRLLELAADHPEWLVGLETGRTGHNTFAIVPRLIETLADDLPSPRQINIHDVDRAETDGLEIARNLAMAQPSDPLWAYTAAYWIVLHKAAEIALKEASSTGWLDLLRHIASWKAIPRMDRYVPVATFLLEHEDAARDFRWARYDDALAPQHLQLPGVMLPDDERYFWTIRYAPTSAELDAAAGWLVGGTPHALH